MFEVHLRSIRLSSFHRFTVTATPSDNFYSNTFHYLYAGFPGSATTGCETSEAVFINFAIRHVAQLTV